MKAGAPKLAPLGPSPWAEAQNVVPTGQSRGGVSPIISGRSVSKQPDDAKLIASASMHRGHVPILYPTVTTPSSNSSIVFFYVSQGISNLVRVLPSSL